MSVERDAMIKSLKDVVIPVLRQRGFKGSFPHYYRKLEERTDLIMFQFSMWGGVLYVEISKCSPEGHTDVSGKFHTPNKMRVYYIGYGSAGDRHRIGSDNNEMFEFNKENTDEIAKLIRDTLVEAEEWWSSFPNWWD